MKGDMISWKASGEGGAVAAPVEVLAQGLHLRDVEEAALVEGRLLWAYGIAQQGR